jgi:hypothetical protein
VLRSAPCGQQRPKLASCLCLLIPNRQLSFTGQLHCTNKNLKYGRVDRAGGAETLPGCRVRLHQTSLTCLPTAYTECFPLDIYTGTRIFCRASLKSISCLLASSYESCNNPWPCNLHCKGVSGSLNNGALACRSSKWWPASHLDLLAAPSRQGRRSPILVAAPLALASRIRAARF